MLLQALVEYYEILAGLEDYDIAKPGYSTAKISYVLLLSKTGQLKGIRMVKHLDSKGKKYIPTEIKVPEQSKRSSGIAPYFLCDNAGYVLGLDTKGKPEKAKQYYDGFKTFNLECLEQINTEEVDAVRNFLNSWKSEEAAEHPILQDSLEELNKGANLVFQVEGYSHYVHQATEVIQAWEKKNEEDSNKIFRTCLVTGKRKPVATIHPSINGIRGGQPMGNTLISFNASAYESYGNVKAQGLNAPVSEYAAFAYGTVLNYLLADTKHRMTLGDATVVFWAQSPKSKVYQDMFSMMNNPDLLSREEEYGDYTVEESAIRSIKGIFEKIANGKKVDEELRIDKKVRFYIVALSPNAARISIRFFVTNEFGILCNKLTKHYQDMAIEKQFENEPDAISIWKLLNETAAPTSREKMASPVLTGAVFRAIWQGVAYPAALLQAVMLRIRAEKEVTYIKAAVIKAYLSRCLNNQKYKHEGVLDMSLNKESNNKAYVLGRLFAALEWTQQDANPGIKATIKERYFTSACATPAVTFPILLRLSNHHISKAEYGKIDEIKINEIMQLLNVEKNPFPKSLALDEQGIFVLGYYHQKNDFYYEVKEKSETKKVINKEN